MAAIDFIATMMEEESLSQYHTLSDTFPIGALKGMIADIGWSDDDLKRLGLARSLSHSLKQTA